MTDLDPLSLAFAAVLLYALMSRRAVPAAPPLLSSRTLAGIAIALAALFTPQPPPVLEERKRSEVPPDAPTLAQEPPDAGADAAAPPCPQERSGAMVAEQPVYAAGHLLAVDHVEGQ